MFAMFTSLFTIFFFCFCKLWNIYVFQFHTKPTVTQNSVLCGVPRALVKASMALGKRFIEYNTRQIGLGEQFIDNSHFVEYFISNNRQKKCIVTASDRVEYFISSNRQKNAS
jgi:hypothetical protein